MSEVNIHGYVTRLLINNETKYCFIADNGEIVDIGRLVPDPWVIIDGLLNQAATFSIKAIKKE